MHDLPPGNTKQDRVVARRIGRWFTEHARALPWRTTPRDPWLALMSEIMLQQTQAARVAERFPAFVREFPTPRAMASRPVDDVLALWSGLGYYRRARMLHDCATSIVQRHGGTVPDDAQSLRDLPGVGRYTAGAVASIAMGQREPLVDGNVSRVLLRLHGVERAVDEPAVQNWAWQRATGLAEAAESVAAYSEGVMELGSTVCTPRAPACDRCPLSDRCVAFERGVAQSIPKPKTRAERQPLSVTAFVVSDGAGRVLLEQRPHRGLWAGLWQPPCVERAAASPLARDAALEQLALAGFIQAAGRSATFDFLTTHRQVKVRTWRAITAEPRAALRCRSAVLGTPVRWIEQDDLDLLGLGSVQRRMLQLAGQ